MKSTTVHLSISGEFITEHARNLWQECSYSKCLDVLDCITGTTREQHEEVIFGRSKFTGTKSLALEPDEWTPPEGYCPSLKEALKRGENYPELLRRREDEAWSYAREEWAETRGNKRSTQAYFAKLTRLVGEEEAERIHNQVMHEKAEEWTQRQRKRPDVKPIGIEAAAQIARHTMAQRLEIAGMDASALASPEAMMNRGYDITPTLDERMESVNGWLLPDGKFYKCGGMEHVGLAARLLPEAQDGEQEAERLGWIKLAKSITGFHCLGQKKPTKRQLTKLFDYAEKHGRNYEELIASLPD